MLLVQTKSNRADGGIRFPLSLCFLLIGDDFNRLSYIISYFATTELPHMLSHTGESLP